MPEQSASDSINDQAALLRLAYALRLSLLSLASHTHASVLLAVIASVVECCQLVALALPSDPARFAWNLSNTASIRAVARLLDQNCLVVYFGHNYAFILGPLVIYSLPVLLFFTGYRLSKLPSQSTTIINCTNFSISLCSSILYFPLLGIAFLMINSSSPALLLLGILSALTLIATVVTCVATVFDYDLGSMSPWARAHSRFELLYFSYRTMSIIVFTITSDLSAALVSFIVLCFTAALTFIFFIYIPYYQPIMNYVRCTLLALTCWAFVTGFISALVNDPVDGGAIFILYGACWLIAVISNLIVYARIKYIRTIEDDQLPNAFLAETKFRFELMDALDKDASDEQMLRRINDILDRAETCFPNSAILIFRSAHLHLTLFNNPFKAYTIMARISEIESGPDFSFMIMRLQTSYFDSQNRLSSSNNADILAYNQYVSLFSNAIKSDVESVQSLLVMWRELGKSLPNADKLRTASHRISSQVTLAKTSYQSLLKIWSQSPNTLSCYAGFLEVLMQDAAGARLYHSKARDLRQVQSSSDSFASRLFNENTAVIICSCQIRNLGEIISVNDKARVLFGAEIIGKSVSVIVPKPFSSQHTIVVERNLFKGRGSILNLDRRLPCRSHRGYLIDCILHVKLFADHNQLSLLAILEPIQDDNLHLIVCDSEGVITAISETFENCIFDVAVGGFFGDILPNYQNLQARDNTVDIHLHGKTAQVGLERVEVRSDDEVSIFFIARISLSSQSADASSQRSDFIVDAFYHNSVQAAIINDVDQNTEEEYSVMEQSALACSRSSPSDSQIGHSSIASAEILTASKSSQVNARNDVLVDDSSLLDSTHSNQNESLDNKKHRERMIRFWLNRSSVLFLVLITLLFFAAIVIKYGMISSRQHLSLRISQSASRATDLVSLSLAINDLQLMADNILDSDRESNARKEIELYSQNLFTKNSDEWLSQDSLSLSLSSIENSQVPLLNKTLVDALALSTSESRVIRDMSLQQIHESHRIDSHIYLMCSVAESLQQISSFFIMQSFLLSNSYVMLQIILPILACVAFFMLTVFLLRPALVSSLDDKDQVLLQLLQIPRARISEIAQTCLHRLQTLTGFDHESPGAASGSKVHDNNASNPGHRFDPQQLIASSNRDKKRHFTQLAVLISSMALIYAAALTVNVIVMVSVSDDGKTLPQEISWLRYEEYRVRRSFFILNQILLNRTNTVSPSQLSLYMDSTSDLMNGIMYGDFAKGLPRSRLSGSNEIFSLQFNTICSLPSMLEVSDCTTFRSGVALNGLHSVFVEFLSLQKDVLGLFTSGFTKTNNVAALFSSKLMNDLTRLENKFLRPALLEFVRLEENYITSNAFKANLLDVVFGTALIIVNILVYLLLIRPALKVISTEFTESCDLYQLLPSKPMNGQVIQDGDLVHPVTYPNEIDQLIVDFDDRNVAALASRKARLKRLRTHRRRRRLSSFGRIHGILRSHHFTSYTLSVVLAILIASKAYPLSLKFSSFDTSGLVLGLGSLLAGMIPIDAAILLYPLTLFDRFTVRTLIMHINSVASLAATSCIILSGHPVEWTVVTFSTAGAALAAILNIYKSVPQLLQYDAVVVVLAAITLGLCFGMICVRFIFSENQRQNSIRSCLHTRFDLFLLGFVGGIIVVIGGTGIGVFVYVAMISFFLLNERIALTTSIIVSGLSSLINIAIIFLTGDALTISDSLQFAIPISVVLMPLGLFFRSTSLILLSFTLFKFIACCVVLWEPTGIVAFIGAITSVIWACVAFIFGVSGTIQV